MNKMMQRDRLGLEKITEANSNKARSIENLGTLRSNMAFDDSPMSHDLLELREQARIDVSSGK